MPDEMENEATRSDVLSVAESLFGETADGAAAAVAKEEDADQETEQETDQDRQGSDGADEEAGTPAELKVVVSIKGRQGHHRGATALIRPAHRVLR